MNAAIDIDRVQLFERGWRRLLSTSDTDCYTIRAVISSKQIALTHVKVKPTLANSGTRLLQNGSRVKHAFISTLIECDYNVSPIIFYLTSLYVSILSRAYNNIDAQYINATDLES